MRPDAVYLCVKNYRGRNDDNQLIQLFENREYSRTSVNMADMGMPEKGTVIYVHDFEDPRVKLPALSDDEFTQLEDEFLQKTTKI